jgi:hypothetical protein
MLSIVDFNLYKSMLKSCSSKREISRELIQVKSHIFHTTFVWVREVLINYRRKKRQLESTNQENLWVFMNILDGFEKVKTRRIYKGLTPRWTWYNSSQFFWNWMILCMFFLFINVQNFLKLCKYYHIKNINAPGRHDK